MGRPLTPSDGAGPDLRTLFEAHFDDVWRFARRRCATTEDADDIAAETFAIASRRADELPPGRERLWLFGVARRVLANQRRSTARREGLRARLAEDGQGPAPLPADERGEDAGLWVALAALSPEDREVLLMRAWDELAVQEIAVVLGCTPNAVSLRLHRARGRLRDALDGGVNTTDHRGSRTRAGRPSTEEGATP